MVWVSSFLFLALSSIAYGQSVNDHDQVVICYVSSWAIYRPGNGKFTLDNVDPTLCTHIVYAFTGIDKNTHKIKPLDRQYDINKGGFAKAVSLKQRNPRLKVTVAVGGWGEGSPKYSNMASTIINRKAFIDSAIELITTYGFDGLDVDWEYPSNRGGKPVDKENFVLLLKELKAAFSRRNLLLTAALAAGTPIINTAYDLPRISQYLDYIHIMTYDYHGKWDLKTGHNAPLYARIDEIGSEGNLNVNHTIRHYLRSGVPVEKLVLGLGVYGRTFLLNDTTNPGIGAPAMKSAFSGPYTREDGFLGYNEICEKQTTERGWAVAWQSAHQAPYMFKDNMWVSFDDHNSIGLKVAFSQRLGLAGVMVWSIDTDDFRGQCGQIKFPLLRAINRNLAIHAPNRYKERVSTTRLPSSSTARPIPGVSTPFDSRFPPTGVPIPGVSTPFDPRFPPTGVPIPGVSTPFDPRFPDTGVPIPGVSIPFDPRYPDTGVPIPFDPRYPDTGVPLPGAPTRRPDGFTPEYRPVRPSGDTDYNDGLDQDKPIHTHVDFNVEGDNDVNRGRYYPSELSSAPRNTMFNHVSIIISIMCLYNFVY